MRGAGEMGFENWNRFVAETIQRHKEEKEAEKQGGRPAGSATTGGKTDERKSKRSAQGL